MPEAATATPPPADSAQAAHIPQSDSLPTPVAPKLKSLADRARGEDGKFVKTSEVPDKPAPEKKESETPPVEADTPEKKEPAPPTSTRRRLSESLKPAPEKKDTPEPKADAPAADEFKDLETTPPDYTENMRKRDQKWKARNQQFQTEAEAARKEKAELEKRAKELEAQLTELKTKAPVVPETYAQEREELLRLRRLKALDTDPEVQKFDTRINDARKIVDDTIAASNLPQWAKDEITKSGGLDALSRSSKRYTMAKGADGTQEEIDGAEFYRRILHHMNPVDADMVKGAIADQRKIGIERQRFVEQATKDAAKWHEEQEKKAKEGSAADQQRRAEIAKAVEHYKKAAPDQIEWLRPVEEKGTPEEIAAAKATNQVRTELRGLLIEEIEKPFVAAAIGAAESMEDLQQIHELIVDSVRAFDLEAQLASKDQEIQRLQKQISDLKAGSRTTSRNGGGATVTTASAKKPGPKLPHETTLVYSMRLRDEGFDEADRQAALAALPRGG